MSAPFKYHHDELYETAQAFIAFFLQNSWFKTGNKFQANSMGRGGMIFRGQSNAAWKLLPTAFRPDALRDFTPQPPAYTPGEAANLRRYLGNHLHAEGRAVFIFLEAADRMGLPSPIDYTTTRDGIELLQALFKDDEKFDYGRPFPEKSFERATALAQHHGVPTRFLDWSESPLVAAYFAAVGVSSVGKQTPDADQEIAVYFMSAAQLKEKSPIEIISAPRHENSFLRQQHGVFTNQRYANQYLLANKAWPTLEDSAGCEVTVNRARLPAGHANSLLRELYDLGMHQQTLMPSMDNAAKIYSYANALFSEMDAASVVLGPAMMEYLQATIPSTNDSADPPTAPLPPA